MFKKILTELKKTKWPTGEELLVLTVYTVILCAVVAIAITGLDLAFFKIRDWYINVNIF